MRGAKGTGSRKGNAYYLGFLDYVFEKNQQSAIPASRKQFYNIAQQVWKEIELRVEKEGVEQVFCRMKSQQRNI